MERLSSAIDSCKFMGHCVCLAWHIWKSTNDWVFNSVPVNLKHVVDKALFTWNEFLGSLALLTPRSHNDKSTRENQVWKAPPAGLLKINCDAAFQKGSSMAAITAILRDHSGKIVEGQSSIVHDTSVLQCEVHAIRLAGSLIQANNLSRSLLKVITNGYSSLLNRECASMGLCDNYERCKSFHCSCSRLFTWAPRNCNRATHQVAYHCLRNSLPLDWVSNWPFPLSLIWIEDASLEVVQFNGIPLSSKKRSTQRGRWHVSTWF